MTADVQMSGFFIWTREPLDFPGLSNLAQRAETERGRQVSLLRIPFRNHN
jgi:hypothetical protein